MKRIFASLCMLVAMTSCMQMRSSALNPDGSPSSIVSFGNSSASQLSLVTPVGPLGSTATPAIHVSGVSPGDIVKIYTDAACTQLVGAGTAGGSSVDVGVSPLTDGTYSFHATTTSTGGVTTACSIDATTYTYQSVPKISFARNVFSANGTTAIGQSITVTRDAPGIVNTVTLTADALTARSGQFTAGTQTVSFGAADTSVTVPLTSFAPVTNVTVQGDNFFRIKLSGPTGGAALGTTPEATVNLLDQTLSENYFFSSPLYTADEAAGSVSILVSRAGSTAAASSVTINFIDGSASAGTDYTNTPITLTFGIGVAEMQASIPITNRSGYQPNRSFYIELKSPTNGATNRAWATAKVRIIDAQNISAVCDATNTNLSVNAGFGGGAGTVGSPYFICSLAQLNLIRTHLAESFRLLADLDLDPSLDADPNTAGLQPFLPILGPFTGTFNGDEHILKNFRYTADVTTSTIALFSSLGGNPNTLLDSINLVQTALINTDAGGAGDVGGIAGSIDGPVATLRNNLVSAYLYSTSGSVGGILNRSKSTMTAPFQLNFTHGLASAPGTAGGVTAAGGQIAGDFDNGSQADFDRCFSVMNVSSVSDDAGGLAGSTNYQSNVSFSFSDSHAKGVIMGSPSAKNAGGLIGAVTGIASDNFQIQRCFSDSKVYAAINSGGLIGLYNCPGTSTCGITDSHASGAVSSANGGMRGGLIGKISFSNSFDISNSYATGMVSGDSSSAGGLIGFIDIYASSMNLNITASHTAGPVVNTSTGEAGGLIGSIYSGSGTGTTVTLNNLHASGDVIATATSGVGGLLGAIWDQSTDGGNTFVVENSYSNGAVTGNYDTGGVIGELNSDPAAASTLTFSNLYSTGTVTGMDYNVGGVFGYFEATSSNMTVIGVYSSGSVTGSTGAVGGVFGAINFPSGNASLAISASHATGNISGFKDAGGFIGASSQGGVSSSNSIAISKVYATGNVTATQKEAGGLTGNMDCGQTGTKSFSIAKSYATGAVSAPQTVGGFMSNLAIGDACAVTISDSYSSGAVTGTVDDVGGFIAILTNDSSVATALNHVASFSPSISGPAGDVGGVLEYAGGGGTVTFSSIRWLKDTSINASVPDDTFQKSVAQLQTQATYTGWDFATIWNAPTASSFPTLR